MAVGNCHGAIRWSMARAQRPPPLVKASAAHFGLSQNLPLALQAAAEKLVADRLSKMIEIAKRLRMIVSWVFLNVFCAF